MTLACPRTRSSAFLDLARRREVEATVLGEFTDDGFFHVTYGDETVAHLDMEFLHDGDPDLDLDGTLVAAAFSPSRGRRPSPDRSRATLLARCCAGSTSARARPRPATTTTRSRG